MRHQLKAVLTSGVAWLCIGGSQASAQDFGNAYFFGDSLTTCCVVGRSTQSNQPNWADRLPGAIGASFVPSLATNLAVGGAQSGTNNLVSFTDASFGAPTGLLAQTSRFAAGGTAVSARDIAGVWIGTNDIGAAALPTGTTFAGFTLNQPIGGQPPAAVLGDYVAGNVRSSVNTLVGAGFRSIVLVTPYDQGQVVAATFNASAQSQQLATQYSEALRDRLAQLYTPGVNTYFMDNLTLVRRVQANPGLYGFDHVAATDSCAASATCPTAPLSVQERFLFSDPTHVTSGYHNLMVRYVANTINARASLPAQGDLGQAVGTAFSNILLNRLEAYRGLNTPADLPNRTVAPSAIPVMLGSPVSLFVEGAYAGIDRNARATPVGPGNPGLGADFAGVTAGIEYRVTPNLLIGAAFNYLNTSVDLRGPSNARIDLDSYQGGVFASFNTGGLFVDGAVTYGTNNYRLSRPGVIDTLTASPDGNTLTAAGKIGYLFDFGTFRVGPVAELTYANVHLGSYRERGDDLLTLGVRNQDLDGLTGGAGIQVRTTLPILGGLVSPFVNLTAQHDFLDGVRTITSFSTNAPALLINTGAGRRGDDVYGKVAGGFSVDLGNGLNGVVSGSSTFGRSYGDDYTVSAGVRYRF